MAFVRTSYCLLAGVWLAFLAWGLAMPSKAAASCGDYARPVVATPNSPDHGAAAHLPMADDHHGQHPCPNCSRNRRPLPPASPSVTVSGQEQWACIATLAGSLEGQPNTHVWAEALTSPLPMPRGIFHPPRLAS